MKNISNESIINEFPVQIKVAPGLVSIVNRLNDNIQKLVARARLANAEAWTRAYYQRRMQKQLDQDTINYVPLEMKLRMGFHR
jgi:hypothetical protein